MAVENSVSHRITSLSTDTSIISHSAKQVLVLGFCSKTLDKNNIQCNTSCINECSCACTVQYFSKFIQKVMLIHKIKNTCIINNNL